MRLGRLLLLLLCHHVGLANIVVRTVRVLPLVVVRRLTTLRVHLLLGVVVEFSLLRTTALTQSLLLHWYRLLRKTRCVRHSSLRLIKAWGRLLLLRMKKLVRRLLLHRLRHIVNWHLASVVIKVIILLAIRVLVLVDVLLDVDFVG